MMRPHEDAVVPAASAAAADAGAEQLSTSADTLGPPTVAPVLSLIIAAVIADDGPTADILQQDIVIIPASKLHALFISV